MTTLTSREFNQDASRAKKALKGGPVFIVDRGKPVRVLLSIVDYKRPTGLGEKTSDLLALPDSKDIELHVPPRRDPAHGADLF